MFFFSSLSAGSRFWQGGTFEVLKTSDLAAEGEALNKKTSLDVSIPSELEGVAYIQVEVKSVPGNKKMFLKCKSKEIFFFYLWCEFFADAIFSLSANFRNLEKNFHKVKKCKDVRPLTLMSPTPKQQS